MDERIEVCQQTLDDDEEEEEQSMDEIYDQLSDRHVSRTKSDTKRASGKAPQRRSASMKSVFAHFEEDNVESRRPATVREGKDRVTEVDDEVDARADDFINKFKQQLKLQRLDSIIRYKDMITRGGVQLVATDVGSAGMAITSGEAPLEIKVMKVEREWWNALKRTGSVWYGGESDILDRIFVPLKRNRDLMTQLAEDINSSFLKAPHGGGCKIKVEVVLTSEIKLPNRQLLGQKISLQLISAVDGDPANGFRGTVGQPAYFKHWNAKISSIDRNNVALSGIFDWDMEMGVPGAFIINFFHNGKEFYLRTLTIEDVPGYGRMHFVCNSWICSAHDFRVFFTNQTYLPSEMPAPLRLYREEELMNLRKDGTRMLRKWDRVYDYDYYNDLGDPDKGSKYVRPVLGGSTEYPYPRRGKTNQLPTMRDTEFEIRLRHLWRSNNYVPRDEQFCSFKLKFLADARRRIELLLGRFYSDFATFQAASKHYEKLVLEFGSGTESMFFKNYKKSLVIKESMFAWKTDEEFTREMLAGASPVIIRLLQEFPPTSKLDPKIYGNQISSIPKGYIETNLDGSTLEEAIKNNRIFILDHHDAFMPYLRRMNTTETRAYATRTILFLQGDGTLKPLAIELSLPHPEGDEFGAISKVCTPAEHGVQASIWQLAKAYVAVNDSGYQLISHWLNTNAVIEPFVIATNRQLSVLHPIYKLLHPHFRDIMQINAFARQFLLNADGVLEKTFSPAEFGMEMSAAAYKNWVFPEQELPVDLIKRGMAVEDSNSPHGLRLLIEDYPYAVDGLEIWLAIKEWVEDYCNYYYKTDETVQKDSELQSWWKELREVGHGDKKDEPWWPQMQTLKELMDTCNTIIWVASGLHAVVNFGQHRYAGYLLNRPTISRRFMPEPGTPDYAELESNPEKVFLETVNTPSQITVAIFLIIILCRHFSGEVYLGQSDTPEWTTDRGPLKAFERFKARLGLFIDFEK